MKTIALNATLYWTPRILAILFGLFVSLFALDSFQGNERIWTKLAHFAIHLIPVAVYALILILAWRWEWIGAVLFTGLGVGYVVMVGGRHFNWVLTISGPLFLLAGLFLLSWLLRRRALG
jgi:hypothetical protein